MLVTLLLVLGALTTVRAAEPPDEKAPAAAKELSRAETETLVRNDLATRLGIFADVPRVVESSSRTWLDLRLGCRTGARRGLEEPDRVAGYLFVLEAEGKRHTYHTDRAGRLVRCEAQVKPLAPILRRGAAPR